MSVDYLLLQTRDYVLLEQGGRVVLTGVPASPRPPIVTTEVRARTAQRTLGHPGAEDDDAMIFLDELTPGWTAPLDYQLYLNGSAFDATGMTVAAQLRDRSGALVPLPTAWAAPALALVRVTPNVSTFRCDREPYSLKFVVTDAGGMQSAWPMGEPERIRVYA